MITYKLLTKIKCPKRARKTLILLFVGTTVLTLIAIVIDSKKAQELGITALLDQIVGGLAAGVTGNKE